MQQQASYGALPAQEDAPLVVKSIDSDDFSAVEPVPSSAAAAADDDLGGLENEMMVCPYPFEDLDMLLTSSGSPTLLFRAAQVNVVAIGLGFLAGTFFSPGVQDAWVAKDPLLALALGSLFVAFSVVMTLLMEEIRASVRGAAGGGKLAQLGAGTALIKAEEARAVQQLPSVKAVLKTWIVLGTMVCGPIIYGGWGLQSPAHNRLSALVCLLGVVTCQPIAKAGRPTLRVASLLIGARVQAVTRAAKAEAETRGQDVSSKEWDRTVLSPCRRMIDDMRVLSDGWGRYVVLGWSFCLLSACGYACLALSPALAELLDEMGEHVGVSWLADVFQALFFYLAVVRTPRIALDIAASPAEISTDADILKECLNDIRICDFSRETDDRICILERALTKCNNGHGVGFCVWQVVIDKLTLQRIGMEVYALVAASAPIGLAYSAFSASKTQPTACEALTPEQAAALVLKLSAAAAAASVGGGNCSIANLTIAEVLGM